MLGVGVDDLAVLGVHGAGDHGGVAAGDADGHHDGLGRAGGAVVHGGVGDLHAGELADHGLELEGGLEGALGDLGLVGGIGGEELAAGDDGVDEHGAVVAVDAGAEKGRVPGCVTRSKVAEAVDDLGLAVLAGDVQVALELELGGDGGEEVVDGADTDVGKHLGAILGGLREVAHRTGSLWPCPWARPRNGVSGRSLP